MPELTRDPTCLKDLTWRLDLPIAQVAEAERRLAQAGYAVRCRVPVVVFDSPEGHRVILVPRTGRVQLRLSYLVPIPERAQAAEALHGRLVHLWSEGEMMM